MPKLVGVRERRHQPFWDTLFRADRATAPNPTVASATRLFAAGQNMSNTEWTNMHTTGQLASDATFIALSLRCFLFFEGFASAYGDSATTALTMYVLTAQQLYLTLHVGDKPQFQAPCWYFPQGGGIWTFDSATPIANNGVPTQESILRMAKAIPIPARQHFYVNAEFFDTGNTSVRSAYINSSTSVGVRECKILIDGIHTRDVL